MHQNKFFCSCSVPLKEAKKGKETKYKKWHEKENYILTLKITVHMKQIKLTIPLSCNNINNVGFFFEGKKSNQLGNWPPKVNNEDLHFKNEPVFVRCKHKTEETYGGV